MGRTQLGELSLTHDRWVSGARRFASKGTPSLTCLVLGLEQPIVDLGSVELSWGINQSICPWLFHVTWVFQSMKAGFAKGTTQDQVFQAARLLSTKPQESPNIISTIFHLLSMSLTSVQIQGVRTELHLSRGITKNVWPSLIYLFTYRMDSQTRATRAGRDSENLTNPALLPLYRQKHKGLERYIDCSNSCREAELESRFDPKTPSSQSHLRTVTALQHQLCHSRGPKIYVGILLFPAWE